MNQAETPDPEHLLRALPCGVFACRVQGTELHLLHVSARALALLGHPTASDGDAPALLLSNVPLEEQQRLRHSFEQACHSGQDAWQETCSIVRGGGASSLEVRVSLVHEASGEIGVCGFGFEPSVLPPRPPALLLEGLPLHSEVLPVGLVITDASEALLITEWNRAAEEIFGFTRDEAVGQSSLALIADASMRDSMRDHARPSIRPDGVAGSRAQNRTKDGRTIWCEWFNISLRDANGAVVGVIGMVQEVTDRLRAEERTRLWSSVLEQSAEGIMICDANQRIMLVNAAFQRLTGFSESEVLGQTPRVLRSGRHDPGFYAVMWDSIVRTGQWHGEVWNHRRDGQAYVEWLSISAVRNARGAVTHYVGIFSDITQRKQTEQRIEHLAHFDALTDLPNRTLLIERVEQSLANARRKNDRVALLFIDLDRFKNINDSMGHAAGDQLLKIVAERLRSSVRGTDLVARMGGDEFVIALPEIDSSRDLAVVADKLLAVLRQPLVLCDHELQVSASIGICMFPDDAADVGELIRNADAAMYNAKGTGRNSYCFYTRDMNARSLETLATESALRNALARDEFVLHYQPQVDVATGALAGAEALIRWRRPGNGLVMPGGFVPVAEERGLIAAIDGWVLQEACRQTARWTAANLVVPRLAVNVSATEFHQPGFVERVEEALREHRVPPLRIELELTESIVMRDSQATIEILHRLRDAGVWLAIDDFGTGYSSLNYLRRFPIHQIKIDQSFVREMLSDAGAAGIVRGIIALAKSLKLAIVAEGVETAEQLEHLRAEGCDTAQGFLFSRAIPHDEFAALLRSWGQ